MGYSVPYCPHWQQPWRLHTFRYAPASPHSQRAVGAGTGPLLGGSTCPLKEARSSPHWLGRAQQRAGDLVECPDVVVVVGVVVVVVVVAAAAVAAVASL